MNSDKPVVNDKNNGHKRNLPLRILLKTIKIIGITAVTLILVAVIACSSILWLLAPERLTLIAEKVASENLNADVSIGRAELTFWKTFPQLNIDLQNVDVISRSLDNLPDSIRRTLPADADSLLSFSRFNGSLNIPKIFSNELAFRNVVFDEPRVNLLVVNDSINNFNIIPEDSDTTTTLPKITIDHFAINNAKPFTYRSIPDSVDLTVNLTTLTFNESGPPRYNIKLQTNIISPWLDIYNFKDVDVAFDASVSWDKETPSRLELRDLTIESDDINVVINTDIDFSEGLKIEKFDIRTNPLQLMKLLKHLPPDFKKFGEPLETDVSVDISAVLDKPYHITDSLIIPQATLTLNIYPGNIRYDNFKLKTLSGKLLVNTFEGDLDATRVAVNDLYLGGYALDLKIDGDASDLFHDPHIKTDIVGNIDFSHLLPDLKNLIKADVGGKMKANTSLDFRLSDLSRENFHKMKIDGNVDLTNFRFTTHDDVTSVYARKGKLEFGSDRSFKSEEGSVDSLLVVKLEIDTAMFRTEGVYTTLSNLKLGAGTQNTASSADTARINPFGGGLSIGHIDYLSTADSMKLVLSNLKGGISLQRWEDKDKIPRLGLKFSSDRIRISDNKFMAGISQADIDVIAHLKPRRNRNERDSIGRPLRQHHGLRRALTVDELDSLGVGIIEFDVDNTLRSLIYRWDISGSIKGKRASYRNHRFPLRSSLRNVNCDFTTDSVAVYNTRYRLGHSDFTINGYIAGIKGALNTRRPLPIRINFDVNSDSINVNELVQAMAAAEPPEQIYPDRPDAWDIEETEIINEDVGENIEFNNPILIPVNIDANLEVKAKTVIYADLVFHHFKGEVQAFAGSVKLNRLSASNEIGRFNLTALYNAPKADQISLGLGMQLTNMHINRLKNFIPHVDSVLPMIRSMSGVINANVALSTDIYPNMDINLSSVQAAFHFEGDSLVVFDNETFRRLAKWLMFKDKNKNMIDSLSIEAIFANNQLNIYPFIINIDRYRLGVMGHSNLGQNLDYHISVLKSPLPFKFGINIKGDIDDPKIRLGGAKFNDKTVASTIAIADTTRINLVKEMDRVFARGIRAARLGPLRLDSAAHEKFMLQHENAISHADSILMINEGFIEVPPDSVVTEVPNKPKKRRRD